jgi:nucleotide-binding universal stress UspA family protein
MYSRILVPLDGSERAANVLPVAARLARAWGATLIFTQVLSSSGELLPSILAGLEPSTHELDVEGATNYLSSLMTLPETQGIPAEIEVHTGNAPSMILEVARTKHADLILLSSHGRTGLTHWALGSVAQKVARHATVPVLLLHEGGAIPLGPHPDPDRPLRALVALDGSPVAEDALGPAIQMVVALAAPGPAALHLVRVVPPSQDLEPARAYLRGTIEQLRTAEPSDLKLALSWSVTPDDDVAHAIAHTAETGENAEGAAAPGGCDLIAITSYGASGRQAWDLGGVAERVLGSTKLPLLVVRSGQETATSE